MYRLLLSILIIIIWRKIEFESIFRNSFRILGAHQIADEFRFIDIDFFFFLINPSLPNIIIIQFVLSSVVVVVVAGQTCTKNHLLFLSNGKPDFVHFMFRFHNNDGGDHHHYGHLFKNNEKFIFRIK